MASEDIIRAIDESPLNRGLRGVDWISNPDNVAVRMGEDIALFDFEGPGEYQVHFLFQSRGREAIARAKEAFARMFTDGGAELIFGMCPQELRQAGFLARLAGGKFVGIRQTPHGPCELFVLSKEMWSEKK